MDLINKAEIKDECLEYIDDDGNSTQCLDQVLRYNELQEKNYIDVKSEIEVKNEPLDIVKENDDPLNIEEEDSINGELVEPSSELNENQCQTFYPSSGVPSPSDGYELCVTPLLVGARGARYGGGYPILKKTHWFLG
ncbi:hypothetical protein Anas_12037 [Armadillidium nasatum]|uniref:Uncharacterized protein n=1 Tax=Armadillidium nasatum TaxID=96803 RepID=A0A5N5T0J4_9CRUS|nr:hypothetical protein Anas_12037 [Armadillidium nasatum]